MINVGLLALILCPTVIAWNCGIGPLSGALSYTLAFPVDLPGINRCCVEHDTLIDALHVARHEADRLFCQCLSNYDSWYMRTIIKPIFCTAVELYTEWFSAQKSRENILQIVEHIN
ncbi:unnamed protein product [Auanema sp. JU1783]|nr:unnamed protein product [Auanema sp. JU1783]